MKRAFTLIELLVVIGIIAVIIALLLPALGRAREQAKSTQCLSNLRQFGQAAYAYAVENRGSFPLSWAGANVYWDFDETDLNHVLPGILWNGRTNLRVQQCPNYDGSSATIGDPYTGYNYNTSYIGGGLGEATPLGNPHSIPARLGGLRRPSEIAMFGDAFFNGGTNKFMRSPILMTNTDIGDNFAPASRLAGTQGYRHLGRTNVCFVDAHAESIRDRYPQAGKLSAGTIIYSSLLAAPGSGFLSPDNSAYDGRDSR